MSANSKQVSLNPEMHFVDKIRMDTDSEHMCRRSNISSAEKDAENIDDAHECQSLNGFSVDQDGLDMDGEHECRSPNYSSSDKCGLDSDNEHDSEVSSVNKQVMDVNRKQEYQSPEVSSGHLSDSGHSVRDEANTYVVPDLGVEFESEEHAYECYNTYAAMEGFSIRKDFVNKSRVNGLVVSRRYTCHKQGCRTAKRNANVKKPRKDTRTGCLAHMTISHQPNGKFHVTHFERNHNHEFATSVTAHLLPSQRRIMFAQAVEAESANNSALEGVPKLGMGFGSEDHAYEYYNTYAGQVGFSIRKDYVNRSKIDGAVASRRFTCFREGFRSKDGRDLNVKRPRRNTRIGCLAQLVIARQSDGKYRATHFEENHNHELVPACRVWMLRSQKRSTAVQAVEEASALDGFEMQPKSASELESTPAAVRESCGYNPIDHRSNLPSKRMRDMKQGEAETILEYFRSKQLKDPSFFYAVQLDVEKELTNVFWADVKMLVDYGDFGDVVCIDTTYKLNKDFRPFTPLLGVNHHNQMVAFGAALLYDETVESFKWLFRKFIDAMSGKKPKTLLTDQDAAMAEAIKLELPETLHRLCAWHVYQKTITHLTQVIVRSDSLASDLRSCFFQHDDEADFLNAWKVMLDSYGLWENEWFHRTFEEREKWAIPYSRNIFCGDLKSAQLGDSTSTNLRKFLRSELGVLQIFKQFGRVVNDWHYKELEANYDMSQHMPRLLGDVILLKHARDVYTPKMFELFQQEYENSLNIVVNQCTENSSKYEYKVSIYGQLREYTVVYDLSDDSVFCFCMKFQFMGILCSHALKVLDYRSIKLVPARYILKRWTRDARV